MQVAFVTTFGRCLHHEIVGLRRLPIVNVVWTVNNDRLDR